MTRNELQIPISPSMERQQPVTIRNKTLREGREADKQEGIAMGEAKLIVKMYKNGFRPEQIASAIDKSVDETKEILSKN